MHRVSSGEHEQKWSSEAAGGRAERREAGPHTSTSIRSGAKAAPHTEEPEQLRDDLGLCSGPLIIISSSSRQETRAQTFGGKSKTKGDPWPT